MSALSGPWLQGKENKAQGTQELSEEDLTSLERRVKSLILKARKRVSDGQASSPAASLPLLFPLIPLMSCFCHTYMVNSSSHPDDDDAADPDDP